MKKNDSIIGKVIKIIIAIIAIPILLISIMIVYKANKYPDKIPDVFGIKPMIVLSGSMEAQIHTGDLVFVKIVDTNTLKENDVISFRNEEDKVTTHRIVEITKEDGTRKFRTKGDANNTEDDKLVEEKDVEGIYIARVPGVGNFLMFMHEPIGLATVLIVILAIGLIWLHFANKHDEKAFAFKNEQERKEFEEYKKMKEQQNNKS